MILRDGIDDCVNRIAVLYQGTHRELPPALDAKLLEGGAARVQKSRDLGRRARMKKQQGALEGLRQRAGSGYRR
jgi:hypothetical protein